MSTWYVECEPDAEDELIRIWLSAHDPLAITRAEARMYDLLSQDPINGGRYLSEGLYATDVPPLVINYRINAATRNVKVTWARIKE